MNFDFKFNETGISCHQKEPKNFGPSLFGPKPVDCRSPEPQSTAFSDLIFTIKKWQNIKNKVTFINEPKKVLFIKVVLFL